MNFHHSCFSLLIGNYILYIFSSSFLGILCACLTASILQYPSWLSSSYYEVPFTILSYGITITNICQFLSLPNYGLVMRFWSTGYKQKEYMHLQLCILKHKVASYSWVLSVSSSSKTRIWWFQHCKSGKSEQLSQTQWWKLCWVSISGH